MKTSTRAIVLYLRFLIRQIPDLIGIFSFTAVLAYIFPTHIPWIALIVSVLAYAFFLEQMYIYFFAPVEDLRDLLHEGEIPTSYAIFGALTVLVVVVGSTSVSLMLVNLI